MSYTTNKNKRTVLVLPQPSLSKSKAQVPYRQSADLPYKKRAFEKSAVDPSAVLAFLSLYGLHDPDLSEMSLHGLPSRSCPTFHQVRV